ncbi:branched-chain amino acid aminotransferase [Strigomonas culicis]|uniref:Branched-chain amino acid aminotransferase n=1 Tax=Strigomonas culicis TaxID=28005 RepID=S9UJB5_9TRYP|nr:branched-chain amino acid aminotransferase [Strigomonas culicis]|eukprot:EPY30907.1 branched-chain amino acid aminotransferase [Strigomonas culicis]
MRRHSLNEVRPLMHRLAVLNAVELVQQPLAEAALRRHGARVVLVMEVQVGDGCDGHRGAAAEALDQPALLQRLQHLLDREGDLEHLIAPALRQRNHAVARDAGQRAAVQRRRHELPLAGGLVLPEHKEVHGPDLLYLTVGAEPEHLVVALLLRLRLCVHGDAVVEPQLDSARATWPRAAVVLLYQQLHKCHGRRAAVARRCVVRPHRRRDDEEPHHVARCRAEGAADAHRGRPEVEGVAHLLGHVAGLRAHVLVQQLQELLLVEGGKAQPRHAALQALDILHRTEQTHALLRQRLAGRDALNVLHVRVRLHALEARHGVVQHGGLRGHREVLEGLDHRRGPLPVRVVNDHHVRRKVATEHDGLQRAQRRRVRHELLLKVLHLEARGAHLQLLPQPKGAAEHDLSFLFSFEFFRE